MSWFRALGFGLLCALLYFASRTLVQVLQGIYLTMHYVPDIAAQYESVDYLQHEVAFGLVYRTAFPWNVAGEIVGLVCLGILFYYAYRRAKRN